MTFEIEIGGRSRTITVEKAGAGVFGVTVDGRRCELDAARVGIYGLSLLDRESGASREVQVTPSSVPGELLITLDGRAVACTVNGRRSRRPGPDGSGSAHGEQAVIAPMPGRVVRILVAAGDEVAVRQGIVVVEAMKMENELRSPKAGRVKEITVVPGTSVEAGRVLVVIE
jgi:biotin carboxyl carrier protein